MQPNRQIILDTETTGLHANRGDRLIEFAGLEMIDRKLTGRALHLRVHPQRDIPEEASRIHGITLDQLEGEPTFDQVGQKIADFIQDAELIIHNAPFDVGFLDMEFQRIGLPTTAQIAAEITDTLVMAKEHYPGQKNSLDALCTRLEIDRSRRVFHGALIDCELLAEVYLGMTRSQFSLIDQLDETETTPSQHTKSQPSQTNRPTQLRIQLANAAEIAAHEAYLDQLEQKTPVLWRKPS